MFRKSLRFFAISIFAGLLIFNNISAANKYKVGEIYSGFKLLSKKFVKEVNSECLYFEHIKSGARLFKIASDDANKTFSIGFKTDPESDCGTPHIMEHSVLNGSKNFPVKSPFEEIGRSSLKTFFNAFTGSDFTCYPFSSMNNKDYFNLMHIYLDAVFNPFIYSDPFILDQEGWHYEIFKAENPIEYKGVVYNEMKGAFSDPNRYLSHYTSKNLFPDNGYRFSSGGFPPAIPNLTFDMFKNYHNKYYHPGNSYILLYGNGELDKELDFIDKEYLSGYDRAPKPQSFPLQKSFSKKKEITEYYSVNEGADTKNQTYLSLNVVAGLSTDRTIVMALNMIAELLINQEAAPIRMALRKAGIGKDVRAEVDEKQQNVFEITVQNANPEDKEKFLEIVFNEIKNAIQKGFDKKQIEGLINRTEFALREGNSNQKGITYNFQVLPGWIFAEDPYLTLEYEKPLAEIKKALSSNMLEEILEKEILKNNHAVMLVMAPKTGLDKEFVTQTTQKLADYKKSLTPEQINRLIDNSNKLLTKQKQKDTPEALATIPRLTREDINPKAEYFSIEEKQLNNLKLLYRNEFTNKIVYSRLIFDLRVLPENLIPYASLLTQVLLNQNTKNYSYADLEKELNIHTGNVSTFITSYLEKQNDNNLIPKFIVSAKCMNNKLDKQFDLIRESLLNTKYDDISRLKEILIRLESRLQSQIKGNPYGHTTRRAYSAYGKEGMFNEITAGFDFYWFVKDLNKDFDTNGIEISKKLNQVAKLLFDQNNLIISVTSSREDLPLFEKQISLFASTLNSSNTKFNNWDLNFNKSVEAIAGPSKVQYVVQGYDIKKLGYNWSGKYKVLEQLLSSDFLHNQLRVIGGAYGGFSVSNKKGLFSFHSYRDPNLKETIDNYSKIPEFLSNLNLNEKELTGYIISTISGIDVPFTPVQKGNLAVQYYFEKTDLKELQQERDEIINTKVEDLKGSVKMINDILDQNSITVYGNEEKINSNKTIFNKIQKIE